MQYSEKIRGQVASVGNAASTGARIALLNNESREEIETVVRKVEKIETAVEMKFQEYFVNAMAIPHKTDAFPNLEEVVTLWRLMKTHAGQPAHNEGKELRRLKTSGKNPALKCR